MDGWIQSEQVAKQNQTLTHIKTKHGSLEKNHHAYCTFLSPFAANHDTVVLILSAAAACKSPPDSRKVLNQQPATVVKQEGGGAKDDVSFKADDCKMSTV